MEVLRLMPRFMEGLQLTLGLWAITLILSLPLAFPVAFIRSSKNKLVAGATKFYIDIMRGTPLLLQMCFIFFGLPEVGIVFPRFTTAVIATKVYSPIPNDKAITIKITVTILCATSLSLICTNFS